MALNRQKNLQIIAMNAKGMTVEAIAKSTGVGKDEVKELLEEKGRGYTELSDLSEEQIKAFIQDLLSKGKATAEIVELTGLSRPTVSKYIYGDKKSEEKEDKPAKEEIAVMSKKEIREYAVRLFHEGKTTKEIIDITGLSRPTVYSLIPAEDNEPKKHGGHNKTSEEKEKKVIELKKQGLSNAAVAKELGISATTVFRIWKENKPSQINEEFESEVDKMIKENKEKEPAPAATDTDSGSTMNTNFEVQDKNTTNLAECQDALDRAVKDMCTMYNGMSEAEQRAWDLGEVFANVSRARGQFV